MSGNVIFRQKDGNVYHFDIVVFFGDNHCVMSSVVVGTITYNVKTNQYIIISNSDFIISIDNYGKLSKAAKEQAEAIEKIYLE